MRQAAQPGSESDDEDMEATRMEQDMDLWQTRRDGADAAAAAGATPAGDTAAAAAAVPAGDAEVCMQGLMSAQRLHHHWSDAAS